MKKTNSTTEKNSVKTRSQGKKPAVTGRAVGYANLIPGANKEGRPKGILNFKTRVTMAIELLAQKYVDDYNKKHPKSKIDIKDVDILGDIFQQAVNKARNGDHKAITDLFDRIYGKATQTVEMTGKDGGPVTYAMKMAEVDAETDAWFKTWVGEKEALDKKKYDKTTGSKD